LLWHGKTGRNSFAPHPIEQPSVDPAATIPALRTKLRLVMELLLPFAITPHSGSMCFLSSEQYFAAPTGSPPRHKFFGSRQWSPSPSSLKNPLD
jgi:hypothetical protein